MNKVLIFPGAFQAVRNYKGYDGWDIWMKPYPAELPKADYYIGDSAGVNFLLARCRPNNKFIFINPVIRKRNLLSLLVSWMKFYFSEGFKRELIIPISSWPFGFKKLFECLKVDVLGIMLKMPKENIVVIRGKKDSYLCDNESAEILKNNGFTVIEVDAGHVWNENIAKAVEFYVKDDNLRN